MNKHFKVSSAIFVIVFVVSTFNSAITHAASTMLDEKLAVGRTASISLNPGNWTVTSNSNSGVATASIADGQLVISGNNEGLATINVSDANSGQALTVALQVTNSITANGNVLGATTIKNGQLVKSGQAIFLVYKNSKIAFANFTSFKGLGYSVNNVIDLSGSNLSDSNVIVNTAKASHPYGSWVNNKGTIYFVHQLGLIPVADYPTFMNNGGTDANTVIANSYDMQLPQLDIMGMDDIRLQ